MLKKGIGTTIAISLLSLGVAAGASASTSTTAEQWGPKGSTGFSYSTSSAVNGQGASTTGYQFQAGKTTGAATFAQKINSTLNLKSQNSNTTVESRMSQKTTTTEPTHVVQNQVSHTSAIQYERSFKGGPTLQFQQLQRTSINYSVGVKTVSPR